MDGIVMRKAAGAYFLVDINQKERKYIPPLEINETGAQIFDLYSRGRTSDEICSEIADGEELDRNEVIQDIDEFVCKVREHFAR
jgi:hypothetical protein